MHTARLFSLMLLLTLRVAGGPLDDLQANFQTRCDFAEADRDLQLKKLDASYLAALDRQVEKTRATGKLDAVIPLIEEVQAVKAGTDPLPDLPEGASLELKQMRGKHAEARAKILKSHAEAITSLADKMETALKSKEQELTKAGKFDDALAAKKMREDLEKNEAIANAKAQLKPNSSGKGIATTISLKDAEIEIAEKGKFFVGWFSEDDPLIRSINPDALATIRAAKADKPLFVITPNSTIRVKFKQPVKKFTTEAILLHPGSDLTISILVEGTTHKEVTLNERDTKSKVQCEIPASRELVIRIHDNGNPANDWAMLIDPMVE
jgi:hypothetical protein